MKPKSMIFVTISVLVFSGCALHNQKTDLEMQNLASHWQGMKLEDFLLINPDIRDPMPLGNGNIRYTYIHDIETSGEIFSAIMADRAGESTYRDGYYTFYLFVNEEGTIYKCDYFRRTRTGYW